MLFKKVTKKISNSGSMMGILASLIQPLRLLVLAPLILTQLDTFEIDIYFLLVSAGILTVLSRARLTNIFTNMLSFAYAGADDLSPIVNKPKTKPVNSCPNWTLFYQVVSVFSRLQWYIIGPLILLSLSVILYSVHNLKSIDQWDGYTWTVIILGLTAVHMNFFRAPVESALKGAGQIALCFKLNIVVSLSFICIGSIIIILGGGLVGLFISQVITSLINLIVYEIAYSRQKSKNDYDIAVQSKIDPSLNIKNVMEWAWSPLWKSMIVALSGIGLTRSAGAFLSSFGEQGDISSFMFAQSILLIMTSACFMIVASQKPQYAGLFAKGNTVTIVEDAAVRIGLASYACLISVTVSGIVIPHIFDIIGSKVAFLPLWQWYLYGIVFVISQIIRNWAMIYDCSNNMVFYKHAIGAFVIGLVGCIVSVIFSSLVGIILSITLSHIVALRLIPVVKMCSLSGVKQSTVWRKVFFPFEIFDYIKKWKLSAL